VEVIIIVKCVWCCRRKKHIILIRKTLTPTSEQLTLLPLRPGANTITFRAGGAADLTAYIYLLRWNTRLVSDETPAQLNTSHPFESRCLAA
jgi:phosphatidate phosphatase PAH1